MSVSLPHKIPGTQKKLKVKSGAQIIDRVSRFLKDRIAMNQHCKAGSSLLRGKLCSAQYEYWFKNQTSGSPAVTCAQRTCTSFTCTHRPALRHRLKTFAFDSAVSFVGKFIVTCVFDIFIVLYLFYIMNKTNIKHDNDTDDDDDGDDVGNSSML